MVYNLPMDGGLAPRARVALGSGDLGVSRMRLPEHEGGDRRWTTPKDDPRPARAVSARAGWVARPPSRARIRGGRPPSWGRKRKRSFSNMDHTGGREPQTESQATKVSVPRRSPTARRHRAPPPPRCGARPGDRQACIFTLLPARPNPRRTPSAPSSSTPCALTTSGAPRSGPGSMRGQGGGVVRCSGPNGDAGRAACSPLPPQSPLSCEHARLHTCTALS